MIQTYPVPRAIPEEPRRIDPAATFAAIVDWIKTEAVRENAPGLIIGLSGTDSLLTFMASARAFAELGKADKVLGVHYDHTPPQLRGTFNHFAQVIAPWLAQNALGAKVEIDNTLMENDDAKRWGHLFSRAVRDTAARQDMNHTHYFPVGTRNATEQALGTYSQISKAVSMLPIVDLYKSEVLEICTWLGVPESAIAQSCQIDCACGRYDTPAHYMRELDLLIMQQRKELTKEGFEKLVTGEARKAVREFYIEETLRNDFRPRTPYFPAQSLVVLKP